MEEQEQEELKTLVHALCLVSRNLPIPASTLDQLHSILSKDKIADSPSIHDNGFAPPAVESVAENLPPSDASQEENEVYMLGGLLSKYEEVIAKRQLAFSSSASLRMEREYRLENKMASRQSDIEFMECSLDGDLYQKIFMEKQAHKLAALQKKIRRDIAAEFYLQQKCSSPDMCLFDWGLLRLARTSSAFFGGLHGDAVSLGLSTIEADERICRKREAERQRRLEEEEHSRVAERKKKFFNDLLNFVREFQLQVQAAVKRRRQRNDGVQGWHAKQRQRATRAERLRFQALKADDQEAYMRMVEESKNERLTTLLEKTDELLQRLGAMVQIQKEAAKAETQKKERPKEKMKEDGSHFSSPTQCQQDIVNSSHNKAKNKTASDDDQREDVGHEEDGSFRRRDLLEGQRQYNSLVHSIEEKVTEQPAMLIGGQLRPYQLEGLQWMLSLYNNNLNGILADEMGLGKTIQTIALLAYLIEKKGLSGPHLIIAPKAVLPNWAQEFIAWAPSMVAVYYDGRLDERKILREQYKDGNFNVLITHYDLIMRDKAFLRKVEWDYMIVDEGHRLKNHDCILSQTLTTGYQIRRRLLLTGTPIQNSLQELWALLNFLLPAIFNSCQNFEEWFSAPFADPSVVSLTEEEQLLVIHRLHQVIRPFLLRRKKSEVEKFLPSKTQVILKCDMSAWQRAYYQQITESGRVGLASGSGKSRGLQNTAMQLRKCCNHPYLFLEGGDYNTHRLDGIIRSSGKFELLDRILPKLQKSGHRVLLFSQMTRLMDILGNFLMLKGIKYLRLDGTTKTEERSLLLKQFNAPDSPFFIFLLSTRAGGLGLNLQTADTVILFDSDWNPQMDQQAEDRAHRIGQKREVRVFVLVSVGSIEEEILERAKSKMGIDEKVIQAGLFNTTSTAQERREMLEEIMRRGTDALGTDVPSEREINRVVARNEEEFRLFERMDAERRKKEGYRSRLIEEHEIPDWVFLLPESKNMQTDIYANLQAAGKRKRKEVIYTDAVSDSQWEKAVEEGEDVTELEGVHLSKRHKKRDQTSLDAEQSLGGNDNLEVSSAELDISYSNNGDTALYPSYDRIHESDTYEDNEDLMNSADVEEKQPMKRIQTLKFKHPKKLFWAEEKVRSSTNYEDGSSFSEQDQVARWKGLRKKRTSHAHLSSEDSTFSGEKSRAYFEYY